MAETRDIPLQASIFLNDEGHISDPGNGAEGYYWVTVFLPERMSCRSQSANQVMSLTVRAIRGGKATIGDRASHSFGGGRCISLPVKDIHQFDRRRVLDSAADIAMWWLSQIRIDRVDLDQFGAFNARVACPEHINSLWDVSHGLCSMYIYCSSEFLSDPSMDGFHVM
jgi:hypothetical protein